MKKFLFVLFLLCVSCYIGYRFELIDFNKLVQTLNENETFVKYKRDIISITSEGIMCKDDEELIKGISGENVYVDDDFYIYYTFLNDNEKELYKQVYANASNMYSTFSPTVRINPTELEKTVKAVYYDHPEIFWVDTKFNYKYTEDNNVVEVTIDFNETMNDIETAQANFETVVSEIVDEAKGYSNILDQERFVHDKLLEMVSYDENATLNQSAYSALVLKKSVCAGYAKSFQLIMTRLGVPTYYVIGTAEEEHAWNIVKLGTNYVNVDTTWDDFAINKYKYYNKKDDYFSLDHTRTDDSNLLPVCS